MGDIERDKNVPGTSLLNIFTSYSSNIAIVHLLCKVWCSNSKRFPPKISEMFVTWASKMTQNLF